MTTDEKKEKRSIIKMIQSPKKKLELHVFKILLRFQTEKNQMKSSEIDQMIFILQLN